MAVTYQYPIEHQDDFLGTISFEALIEPPIETTLFGGVGRDRQGGSLDVSIESQFLGLDRAPIASGIGGVVSDGTVVLYLPGQLQIQDGVSYDNNISLGAIGAIGAGLVSSGANIANASVDAMTGSITSFVQGIMNNSGGDLARLAAVRVAETAKSLTPEMTNAVKSVARVTPNPNTRTLFRGVQMRAFNFDFTLIPNSVREAQEINNIIRFFRTQLYPEDIGGTSTIQGVYGLKFPNKFAIKVQYNNKELGIRFLPCYLTSFQAVYNRQGGAMHKDGNWNEVAISLSFTETRTLVKQDIQAGY